MLGFRGPMGLGHVLGWSGPIELDAPRVIRPPCREKNDMNEIGWLLAIRIFWSGGLVRDSGLKT